MELVVAEFPGHVPGRTLAPELHRLVEQRVIRIVDIAFVRKGTDGAVTMLELGDYEGDPEFEALDTVVETVEGLIAEQDLTEIAREVGTGTTAVVLLFEHIWATTLRAILTGTGGEVVFTERIPAPVVEAVEAAVPV
jgi:hypothetical protein